MEVNRSNNKQNIYMKSNFVLSGMIALEIAATVCGCSEFEEPQGAPAENKSRISATIVASADTRIALTDGGKIAWENSDKIGVFTPGAVQVPFDVERIDGSSATFVSPYAIDLSAASYYAVFPYDEVNRLEGEILNFHLPDTQNYRRIRTAFQIPESVRRPAAQSDRLDGRQQDRVHEQAGPGRRRSGTY